jgi:hypothetical protein
LAKGFCPAWGIADSIRRKKSKDAEDFMIDSDINITVRGRPCRYQRTTCRFGFSEQKRHLVVPNSRPPQFVGSESKLCDYRAASVPSPFSSRLRYGGRA